MSAVQEGNDVAGITLVRLEPSHGRGERFPLDPDAAPIRIGRSTECGLRLYSPSSSREHAVLDLDQFGTWWITPLPAREVWVDGEPTGEPCPLENGLNLVFGSDRLRCARSKENEIEALLDEDEATAALPVNRWTAKPASPLRWIGLAGLIALGIVAASAWMR